jgi:hypothetical protein
VVLMQACPDAGRAGVHWGGSLGPRSRVGVTAVYIGLGAGVYGSASGCALLYHAWGGAWQLGLCICVRSLRQLRCTQV